MIYFIFIVSIFAIMKFIILGPAKIRMAKPKVRRLNIVPIFVILFIVGSMMITGCTKAESKTGSKVSNEIKEIALERTPGRNEFLKDNVTLLQKHEVDIDSYKLSIAGFKVDISSGDSIEDTFAGDGLVNEAIDESTQRGFYIGFENAKAEVKNRDGYLSLYLKFDLDDDVAQRDSIIPKFKIKVKDDKGDKGMLIYNSHKEKYIDLKSPYGVVLFKIYSDSEEFEISIDDTIVILNMSEL